MGTLTASLHAAFHDPGTRIYRVVEGIVWGFITLSIVSLVVEALLPDGSAAGPTVRMIDRILLAIFAVEIILRVGTYRPPSLKVFRRPPMGRLRAHLLARLGYVVRPLMLVDILAVLALFPELRGLRALRLLRLLRTAKLFRYRNPFAIILQALEENGLLFTFAFTVLGVATLLGGVSFYLVEVKLNSSIVTVMDGMWWALVTVTTVGFGDITPVTFLGRIIGAVLMVGGMFTLALFAGIVGSSLVRSIMSVREEQFRMSEYVNHVVVCGYDESTHLLSEALLRELHTGETRVVIFDNHERPADLHPDFIWVQGDPTKASELDKVRLTDASAVIITGARDMSPQTADARTILIAFTIRSFLKRSRKRVKNRFRALYVLAEILDSENVGHAIQAGADEVVETRKIGYSMIAHALRHHGTAATLSRFVVSGPHNVYIGQIPDAPDQPVPFGELMVKMQLSKRGGLAIGVRAPSGIETINPPKTHVVEPGTLIIYLAERILLEPPA